MDERVFYIVGATMARRIEEQKGRHALVATIKAGPRAFFAAYAATSPSQELRVEPPDAGQGREEGSPALRLRR